MSRRRTLTSEEDVFIRLHTLSLVVSGWFPPGSPMADEARRAIGPRVVPSTFTKKQKTKKRGK